MLSDFNLANLYVIAFFDNLYVSSVKNYLLLL